MTDGRDDVSDRLANRFERDDDAADDKEATDAQQNNGEVNDKKAETSMNAGDSSDAMPPQKAKNVKKAWNAKSVYLPDDLDNDLSKAFKRLDLELDDDLDLKKTRHFYPLVVELGLERIEEMERTELLERIE